MLRNCNGFTLIEVLFALVIFTVVIASTASILFIVLNERQSVSEQLIAYEILNNTFEKIRTNNELNLPEKTIERNGTTYSLSSNKDEVELHICVEWQARNKRAYEECGVIHLGS